MSQTEEQKKAAVTKGLAVVGLLTAILLLVWLAVQIASLMPSAFGSLASLADSVYNHDRQIELNVGTERKVVNSGDVFSVTWDEVTTPGSYSFQYACVDGVSLTIRQHTGQVIDLLCNTIFPLSELTTLELIMRTEQTRFADVTYTIGFVPELDASKSVTESAVITIVNPSIPAGTTVAPTTESEPSTETENTVTEISTPLTTTSAPTTDNAPAAAVEQTPVTPTTPSTQPTQQFVEAVTYSIPVSDPSGYTDLKISYRGLGVVVDGKLSKRTTLKEGQTGGVSFMVENIGTKTSEDWRFTAQLPDGTTYRSAVQAPLQPGEIATLIMQFPGVKETGTAPFTVSLDVDNDRSIRNNSFTWSVRVE